MSYPPPVVILVGAQLGENIGMSARAMFNCGVNTLRLVRPRDGWCDNADAVVQNPDLEPAYQNYVSALMSSAEVLRKMPTVQVFDTLTDASHDLQFLYASTARKRTLHMDIYTPSQAGKNIVAHAEQGVRTGVVFGCEANGLLSDDVAQCHGILTIPLNPDFTSLNLSQAVLLSCWEWWRQVQNETNISIENTPDSPLATIHHTNMAIKCLENALNNRGFFKSDTSGPTVKRNLHALFNRIHMTEQEVQMLHGIIKCLTEFPKK